MTVIIEALYMQLFIVGEWNQWICKRKREAESDGEFLEKKRFWMKGNKKAIAVKEKTWNASLNNKYTNTIWRKGWKTRERKASSLDVTIIANIIAVWNMWTWKKSQWL